MKLKLKQGLRWTSKIEEATTEDDNEEFLIKGTAINETTTRNNHKFKAEELKKAAQTLNGRPLLKDHEEKVDSIVGRVRSAEFDEASKSIRFSAAILDKDIRSRIKDGRIQDVSVGAMAEEMVVDEENEDVSVVKGIEFTELSLVAVPADPNANFNAHASFAHAIHEAYQENKEELDMAELKKLEELLEKQNKQFDEKFNALESKLEQEKDDEDDKEEEQADPSDFKPSDFDDVEDCVEQHGETFCNVVFGESGESKESADLKKKLEENEKRVKELEARLNEKGQTAKAEAKDTNNKVMEYGNYQVVKDDNGYFVKQKTGNGKCQFFRAKNDLDLKALIG